MNWFNHLYRKLFVHFGGKPFFRTYDKVRHKIYVEDECKGDFESDLVYLKDIPHLVLIWSESLVGNEKVLSVPIRSEYMRKIDDGDVKYEYTGLIVLLDGEYQRLKQLLDQFPRQ